MSTRGAYVFKDDDNKEYCLYKHFDNYPEGAATFLVNAMGCSWDLPRFEADEFGASFIAANKSHAGDIRLTHKPEDHGDIEYVYEVSQAKNGQLIVRAYEVNFWGVDKQKAEIFYGRMKEFVGIHGTPETKKQWDAIVPSPHPLAENKIDTAEYLEYLRLKEKFEVV